MRFRLIFLLFCHTKVWFKPKLSREKGKPGLSEILARFVLNLIKALRTHLQLLLEIQGTKWRMCTPSPAWRRGCPPATQRRQRLSFSLGMLQVMLTEGLNVGLHFRRRAFCIGLELVQAERARHRDEGLEKRWLITSWLRRMNSRKTKLCVASGVSLVLVKVRLVPSSMLWPTSGQYWQHFVRPLSTTVVSMTTKVLWASNTICQKSRTVLAMGPEPRHHVDTHIHKFAI